MKKKGMSFCKIPILLSICFISAYSQKLAEKIDKCDHCDKPKREMLSKTLEDIDDDELLGEIAYLVRHPAEEGKAQIREKILVQYILDEELPKRIRQNKKLKQDLIAFFKETDTAEVKFFKAKLLSRFYLYTDSATIDTDEQVVKNIAAEKERDLDMRITALKAIKRPTKKNVEFLLANIDKNFQEIRNKPENEDLVYEGMMSLARIMKRGKEQNLLDDETFRKVTEKLKEIKNEKDVRSYAFYRALRETGTKEGMDIIEKDLTENNYKELREILMALEEKLSKEIVSKTLEAYEKKEILNTRENKYRIYNALLRTPEIFDTLSSSEKNEDVISFATARKIMGRDENFKKYDSLLIAVLDHEDPKIRLSAMKAIHHCVENNFEISVESKAEAKEQNAENREFLRKYGYLE